MAVMSPSPFPSRDRNIDLYLWQGIGIFCLASDDSSELIIVYMYQIISRKVLAFFFIFSNWLLGVGTDFEKHKIFPKNARKNSSMETLSKEEQQHPQFWASKYLAN